MPNPKNSCTSRSLENGQFHALPASPPRPPRVPPPRPPRVQGTLFGWGLPPTGGRSIPPSPRVAV